MATTIKLKNGSGAPLAGDLVQGEPALDLTNKRLYTENASGTVIEVGTNPTSLTTGTFTSTGIDDNATSTAITIDSSENVGVGTTSPDAVLHTAKTQASGDVPILLENSGTAGVATASLVFAGSGGGGAEKARIKSAVFGDGYMAFHTNNDSEKMRIDASGNVGIGTASPSDKLHVYSGAAGGSAHSYSQLVVENSTHNAIQLLSPDTSEQALWFGDASSSTTGGLTYYHPDDFMTFRSAGSERMRINSSGNVGIGVTSPFSPGGSRRLLQISNSTNGAIIAMNNNTDESLNPRIFSDSANLGFATPNTGSGMFQFYTAGTERMRIDSSGNVDVNGDFYVGSSNNIIYESGTTFNLRAATANLTFQTNGANERMRIDSSGDVLIGTSATSYLNAANRQVCHVNGGTDGAILALTGTASGSYPGSTGDFYIASGASGTTNTSLVTRSNGYMNFYTNNTERMRIDSDGKIQIGNNKIMWSGSYGGALLLKGDNATADRYAQLKIVDSTGAQIQTGLVVDNSGYVGVNSTDPGTQLEVLGNTSSVANNITTYNASTSSSAEVSVDWSLERTGSAAKIRAARISAGKEQSWTTTASTVDGYMRFLTVRDESLNEAMRLNSSGNLLLGTTSTYSTSPKAAIGIQSTGTGLEMHNSGGTAWTAIRFHTASTLAGYISVGTTTTTYNTSSDQRLKENIVDAPAGNIDAIRVRSFDWKADGSHQTYGVVAQELIEVAPEAVSQGQTEDDMWGVDYSKLVPMMIKEIQDLKAEVAALKGA